MKAKALFLSLFILISGLLLGSQSSGNVSKLSYQTGAQSEQMGKAGDGDDCYTYEEVVINGKVFIYVYDCDGNLVHITPAED